MKDDAADVGATVILESIGDAVLSTDLAGDIVYMNLAAEAQTGWTRAEARGRPFSDVFRIIDGESRQTARNPMTLALELNTPVGLTPNCILIRRDGTERAIEDSAAPVYDEHGQVTGAVIVFRNVGAALETSRHMSRLALQDGLTGLPNRTVLQDRLTEAIALGRRRKRPVGVLFLDVDGFKGINDTHGHMAADVILREIAGRLRGLLRQSDTVCRFGGDEFVVVLSEIERASDAMLVANKLLRVLALPHDGDAASTQVTVSIGVTLFPDHGHDAETLITNADAAMYRAKRSGPGHACLFTHTPEYPGRPDGEVPQMTQDAQLRRRA